MCSREQLNDKLGGEVGQLLKWESHRDLSYSASAQLRKAAYLSPIDRIIQPIKAYAQGEKRTREPWAHGEETPVWCSASGLEDLRVNIPVTTAIEPDQEGVDEQKENWQMEMNSMSATGRALPHLPLHSAGDMSEGWDRVMPTHGCSFLQIVIKLLYLNIF